MQTTGTPRSSPKGRRSKTPSLQREETPGRNGVPLGQSFRLKPEYRGHLHEVDMDGISRSPSPLPPTSSSQGNARMHPPRRRLSRSADALNDRDPYREVRTQRAVSSLPYLPVFSSHQRLSGSALCESMFGVVKCALFRKEPLTLGDF